MKKIAPAALLAAAIPSAGFAGIFGSLGNFDVINDTGKPCHGFEIELEGLKSTNITDTFGGPGRGFPTNVERYGSPTIVDTATGVKITYKASFDGTSWSATTPDFSTWNKPFVPADSCWIRGTPNYGPAYPCDHFGVGHTGRPTKTIYRWLTEDAPNVGTTTPVEVKMPAPVWNVVPQPPIQPPPVNNVLPPPIPQPPIVNVVVQVEQERPNLDPNIEFGDAKWVKVFTTEVENPVALEELMGDNQLIQQARQNTEIEWVLLQEDFKNPGAQARDLQLEAQAGNNAEAVVRRFEFYEYVGPIDWETKEAKPNSGSDGTPTPCDAGLTPGVDCDQGKFIGAQNEAVNLNGVNVVPVQVPPAFDTAALAQGTAGVAYSQAVAGSSTPAANGVKTEITSGLPAWAFFDGTTITGTPDVLGTSTINFKVTDLVNTLSTTASRDLTVVDAALSFDATPSPLTVGTAYSQTLAATGGYGGFTFAVDVLPSGLSLVGDTVSGTPDTAGATTSEFTATDALGSSITSIVTFDVSAVACSGTNEVISSFNGPQNGAGAWIDIAGGHLQGGKSIRLPVDPSSITFDPGMAVGVVNPGMLVTHQGTMEVNLQFCQADAMSVSPALALAPFTLPAGTVGVAYPVVAITAIGGLPPRQVSVSGLPGGLAHDPVAGTISGTPTVSGTSTVVVRVTDATGVILNANNNLIINPAAVAPSCTKPANARKSAGKSRVAAIGANSLRMANGAVVTYLPCTKISWNRRSRVFVLGDRVEWEGFISGGVITALKITVN